MPEQLKMLINDQHFHNSLSRTLQKSKAIFIFGCTVALRKGDLFNIKFTDIENRMGDSYLQVKTQKTGKIVRIKLPLYATTIIEQFRSTAKKRLTIFPPIPATRFNNHIKFIARAAGFTNIIIKHRNRRGLQYELNNPVNDATYCFCDHISSHTMRRTAITTMLMLGMNEYVVKLISGHNSNSKSFSRYVNLAQSYLDNQMDTLCFKLAQ